MVACTYAMASPRANRHCQQLLARDDPTWPTSTPHNYPSAAMAYVCSHDDCVEATVLWSRGLADRPRECVIICCLSRTVLELRASAVAMH
jgi:hypothetical protein